MKTAHVKPIAAAIALLCGIACGRDPGGPAPAEAPCQRVASSALELPPPPALLTARRQKIALQDGVIVIAAGEPNTDPQNSGYRGDNSLYYLAGFDAPGSWLIITVRGGRPDSTILYVPEAITSASAPVRLRDVSAVSATRCAASFAQELRARIPAGTTQRLYLSTQNAANRDSTVAAVKTQAGVSTLDLYTALNQARAVKDTAEIARIRKAAEITAASVRSAVNVIGAGRTEGDVAYAILTGYHTRGAAYASFPSIVASGVNALTLHYNANTRTFAGNELVLMDVGAEYGRYSGDVTRTFPVSGKFSERQRALYQLVLEAQQVAIEAVRAGVTLGQLENVSRAYLKANSNGLCGANACDRYFVHSLSHSLGLNVHDPGLGYNTLLQAGTVITIEPGIYLASDSIGIRIEDDVLVTANGGEVLSSGVPKSVSEIEALFAARPVNVSTGRVRR